ncbi:class I SAM-dependent methyltransferase [Neomicrococcus lactis]|uniref:16S rRNA (Guanine1207-N2)-methyltransferase n=1 Tax=Neomicrococcus lactis TaxID=732241 RepID=A0A7W8YAK6_9MICC|nr:methyltransferase [Neomicrococcus lactis]MBB5597886.1 16S rRNA (guanine1207-N2)-methyltransferase [Neomicrococcus lactis]
MVPKPTDIDLDLFASDIPRGQISMVFDFDSLRRWPEPESENLQAHDATDELLLDAAEVLGAFTHAPIDGPLKVVALNDNFGALALPIQQFADKGALPWRITSWNDSLSREQASNSNAEAFGLPSPIAAQPSLLEVLSGAVVILIQAPRSQSELRQFIQAIHSAAHPNALVLIGARLKYLTPSVNDILGEYFTALRASRARSKSRVIVARGKKPTSTAESAFPLHATAKDLAGVPLQLASYGATFGGTNIDPGTRFFLETLPRKFSERASITNSIVDLGCGNGTISSYVPLKFKEFVGTMIATDSSRDAVAATAETAKRNGVDSRVDVIRDDAMSTFAPASQDLILLNPPFHVGNTVDPQIALKLFRASARVLTQGGELWCVWNSHLQYKRELNRIVGPTTEVARNRKFTVTRSVRQG